MLLLPLDIVRLPAASIPLRKTVTRKMNRVSARLKTAKSVMSGNTMMGSAVQMAKTLL
jgi:hypothetical protein